MVWTDSTNGDAGQVHVRDLETGRGALLRPAHRGEVQPAVVRRDRRPDRDGAVLRHLRRRRPRRPRPGPRHRRRPGGHGAGQRPRRRARLGGRRRARARSRRTSPAATAPTSTTSVPRLPAGQRGRLSGLSGGPDAGRGCSWWTDPGEPGAGDDPAPRRLVDRPAAPAVRSELITTATEATTIAAAEQHRAGDPTRRGPASRAAPRSTGLT